MAEEKKDPGLRVNLGSGMNPIRHPGWVNVDKYDLGKPDVVHNLEVFPWPFEGNSVDEIFARHILEHLGQDTETYLKVWQEIYRVMKHGAFVTLAVPHVRCDDFDNDPTHVRKVTPNSLALFDQTLNTKWAEMNAANTPLGLYLGVNFRLLDVSYVLHPSFRKKYERVDEETLERLATKEGEFLNNVYGEVRMVLVAVKEQGHG